MFNIKNLLIIHKYEIYTSTFSFFIVFNVFLSSLIDSLFLYKLDSIFSLTSFKFFLNS